MKWKDILPEVLKMQNNALEGLRVKNQDLRESDFLRGKWAVLQDLTALVTKLANERN
jgi:hypothetical protein